MPPVGKLEAERLALLECAQQAVVEGLRQVLALRGGAEDVLAEDLVRRGRQVHGPDRAPVRAPLRGREVALCGRAGQGVGLLRITISGTDRNPQRAGCPCTAVEDLARAIRRSGEAAPTAWRRPARAPAERPLFAAFWHDCPGGVAVFVSMRD